jgi:hypothetical protein
MEQSLQSESPQDARRRVRAVRARMDLMVFIEACIVGSLDYITGAKIGFTCVSRVINIGDIKTDHQLLLSERDLAVFDPAPIIPVTV